MPDPPAPPSQDGKMRAIIEALVFAAEEPLTLSDLMELFPEAGEAELQDYLDQIVRACEAPECGLQVTQVAGGYRMTTKGDLGEWVRALYRSRNRRRLSGAALETLAIVAYRQPITTPEIQALRGIDPSGVLQNLLEKKLVRILGRKPVVGKPILYGTTRDFLSHFGLNSLEDLPSVEEFSGMLTSMARAPREPISEPSFEEGNGEDDDGEEEEFEHNDEDENERRDDGDDS